MKQTNSLGRATFYHIRERNDLIPIERDIRWFKHIERHGPLTSSHLLDWTADTHRCRDTGLRRLQALRAAGYLFLPSQQRKTERAEFKPYIYDLSPMGRRHLEDTGVAEDTVRPTGHWWHLHETAMFTAKIDLEAQRRGYRYIPAHEILERVNTGLAVSVGRQNLIPDQLLAIDYGGRFRAFMVEVDRGTEPIASTKMRKSWNSTLHLYDHAFDQGVPNQSYGLKAPIQVLWKLSSQARLGSFERLLDGRNCSSGQRHFCCLRLADLKPHRFWEVG